ncbi:MAG: site-specific DNA-methyltransferase [Firmicutes bacterium]|nr:site-specific DNA-methyltransferase [Bacillota bacterium]
MASLFKGDNLKVMQGLKDGCVDFIYLDPPFFSEADYYSGKTQGRKKLFEDRWHGIDDYLDFLRPRLIEMKRLLKDTGLIAVHLDWHAVHYVKVLMDEVFGYNRFVNEIIWAYKSGGASKKSFARKHDNILLYSKGKNYYFVPQKEKSYNRGFKPYHFKGVKEYQDENGWYTLVNQKDIFNIDMVGRTSSERTGYATQKPEALLTMLLKSCCPVGGTAADFFAGSGTLGAAAQSCGCDFILCDENDDAIKTMEKRFELLDIRHIEA